ncbi:methenyltetrahydromethanopterin cyclohydrolase [Halobacteriales archaeon QS_1_68_20]|nr:MAG: methenyltetrahydromethanopterin cyclohydrolase [Halobacteriales archaeon QS_1_68_20]
MDSLNRMAIELVDEALDFADELNVAVHELDDEATVLDFGVEVESGIEAGLLLAEIQTAGLATLQARTETVAGTPRPVVELTTDHPGLALLGSQKAGWELAVEEFEGLGSGPARALVGVEEEYDRMGYREEFDLTALAVESTELPDETVAEHVAERAGVEPSATFLLAYATGSVAGSVTAAARAAELAVFRLSELGYDPTEIVTATGSTPVAPVSYDEATAIGRTTDAVAYGGQVHLQVAADFDRFDEVPSSAGAEYGRPLVEVFEDADWDFEALPEDLVGPAQVTVDVLGGPTYALGDTSEDVLGESFE